MTSTTNTLDFLFSLLYPPLRELFPFQPNNENREIVRQTLNRILDAIQRTHNYQHIALCEFNSGLYHMEWGEVRRAQAYFHKARFHGGLAQNDPFVCLAYFAESCAHDHIYETASALAICHKAKTNLINFKGLLRTHRQARRLNYFTNSLEQQMEIWHQFLDNVLRTQPAPARPTTPGQLVTDGVHLFRWFEVDRATGTLLRGFQSGDWVLAQTYQHEDGSWGYDDLYIIGHHKQMGVIRLQPYPLETTGNWYLGQIKEWIRDRHTGAVAIRPLEPIPAAEIPSQSIERIVITHFQEQGMIDLA